MEKHYRVRGERMGSESTPKLETERLVLRKFTDNDLQPLFEILSDPQVNTFLPWYPLKEISEAKR